MSRRRSRKRLSDPTRQFVIALVVVLAGVLFGSWLVMRTDRTGHIQPIQSSTAPTDETNSFAQNARAFEPGDLSWTNNMMWIPGGAFWMGSDDSAPDEQPMHLVTLDGFWMDKTEVTNEQFEKFVRATGYLTVAERKPNPRDFPGVPEDKLVPGSIVFRPPPGEVPLENHYLWWEYVPGANWRQPDGPSSSIAGKESYPVVHVCWEDAVAYARWAGKRLPTEAEWEYASRGRLERQPYVWGADQTPGGKWNANIWQGRFPNENTTEDGFRGAAPVASFPSNGYGLFDMSGNVWEWCSDWYRPDSYTRSAAQNPRGPDSSFDPVEPGMPKRVQRGGSFLCADSYCRRYVPSARGKGAIDSGASHVGFRCAKDAPSPDQLVNSPLKK